MAVYPGDIPPSVQSNPNHTLDEANHTALHNNDRAEIVALATKVGKDGSANTSSIDYRLSGVAAGDKAMSLTGVETASNKTFNSTTINSPIITTPNITNPTISGGGSWGGGPTISGSPTIATPIIASFANATHTHANAAGGGQLDAGTALQDDTLNYGALDNSDSSWDWESWSPSYSNLTIGSGTASAKYKQIGKTVFFVWKLSCAADTVVGTTPNFSLPVASNSFYSVAIARFPVGQAMFYDNGAANYPGYVLMLSTTAVGLFVGVASGTYLAENAVEAGKPFAWGVGDEFYVQGFYFA